MGVILWTYAQFQLHLFDNLLSRLKTYLVQYYNSDFDRYVCFIIGHICRSIPEESQSMQILEKYIHNSSPVIDIIQSLDEAQMISFMPFRQFLAHIGLAPGISQAVKKKVIQRLLNYSSQTQDRQNLVVPVARQFVKFKEQQDSGNQEAQLDLFTFLTFEMFAQTFMKEENSQDDQKRIEQKDQLLQTELYQFKKDVSSSFAKTTEEKSQHIDEPFDEWLHSMLSEIQDQTQDGIYQYPHFILYDSMGQTRKSYKYLLSYIIDNVFDQQVQEVRTSLLSQIENEQGHLLDKYTEFVNQIREFTLIKYGQLEKTISHPKTPDEIMSFYNDYLQDNVKEIYFSSKNKSQLLKYWEKLRPTISNYLSKNPYKKKEVKKAFKECLQCPIYTYFTVGAQTSFSYASTIGRQIFINVNQYGIETSTQNFKSNLFKPYLFICILHQNGHIILRQLKVTKPSLSGSNKHIKASFTSDQNDTPTQCGDLPTFGCKMLKIVSKMVSEINSAYNFCDIKVQDYKNSKKLDKMIKKITSIEKVLENNMDLTLFLKDNLEMLNELKRVLTGVFKIYEKLRSIKLQGKLTKEFRQIVKPYKTRKQETRNPSKQEMYQCKFIIALFASDSIFDNLGLVNHIDLNYTESINFLKRKTKEELKQLYSEKEDTFKSISMKINPNNSNFFLSEEVQMFITLFYEQSSNHWLKEQLCKLSQKTKENEKVTSTMDKFFSNANFKEFNSKIKFAKMLKLWNIDQDSTLNFINLCQVFQTTLKMMKFLKKSEIYIISCQIPNIILSKDRILFDSGFYLETILFPNFNKIIYAKDLANLKDIDTYHQNVGQNPDKPLERAKAVKMHRKSEQQVAGLELSGPCGCCFNQYYECEETESAEENVVRRIHRIKRTNKKEEEKHGQHVIDPKQ